MGTVVDFSPRHVIRGGSVEAVAYVTGVETEESITLHMSISHENNIEESNTVTAKRLEKASVSDLPSDTYKFSLNIDTENFQGGKVLVKVLDSSSSGFPFQISQFESPARSFASCGPITGGTLLRIGLTHPFNEVDTKRSFTEELLTGLKIQFAETLNVAATLVQNVNEGIIKSYRLFCKTPDLSAVSTSLFTPNSDHASSGYVPLTLVFPDGHKSSIPLHKFRPISFVRFEPECVDIAGSSPVAALFSPNLGSNSNLRGTIGTAGPVWSANGTSKTVRSFPAGKQSIVAVQVTYTAATADEIRAQAPRSFEFPVTLGFHSTHDPVLVDLSTFSLNPLSTPFLIPMDSDSFSIPICGQRLYSSVRSLIMYVYPNKIDADKFMASVFDIEYVSATEWRVVGPKSSRWAPINTHYQQVDAFNPGSLDPILLSGCIMSPFFLSYYAGAGTPSMSVPPATIQMRTYFFDHCNPRFLPRTMRNVTDYVEITVSGKGFGDARLTPKILITDYKSGQMIAELQAAYLPSQTKLGEQVIVAKYFGSPYPSLDLAEVSAQIDGTNWVKLRYPSIALYDIPINAISPLNGNWFTPVSVAVAGLSRVIALKKDITATVTFCDDDAVNPSSPQWKLLTRKALVGVYDYDQEDLIVVTSPPKVTYRNPSFRLQVSIDGQPPISTTDLCNMMTVDFVEPSWIEPFVEPAGRQLRIVGSNFVDFPVETFGELEVKIASVLPQNLVSFVSKGLLYQLYGPGRIDENMTTYEMDIDSLQVRRVSSSELVVTGVPALPPGLYDFKLGRDGEVFAPCQRLLNVYAWGVEKHTLSFGARQRPTVALPFLSNSFPFKFASINSDVILTSTKQIACGRIRINKYSTELGFDPSSSSYSFVAPLMERNAENNIVTYSPDGQRYVVMPNINVVILNVSHIEPSQVAAQVPTKFTLYGGPFLSISESLKVELRFHTLLPSAMMPIAGASSTIILQPNSPVITVENMYSDRLEFSTTLEHSGALVLIFTIRENSPLGSVMQSIWPPQYVSMVESGTISSQMMSTAAPWPRLVNAFGIHLFEPRVTHAFGDSVISLHLHDTLVNKPSYLLPIVKLDTIYVRFQAQKVYAQGVGSLPYADTSDPWSTPLSGDSVFQQNLSISIETFERDNTVYLQKGWIKRSAGNAQSHDTTSIICVRAPRVRKPGLYSISLSANGSPDFSPVLSGDNIFLYETGAVLSNNSIYALANPKSILPDIPIIITGQFLPPSTESSFVGLQELLFGNAQLRVGPLDGGGGQESAVLSNPSVTASSLTFFLPSTLLDPATMGLYLRATSVEPYRESGALLSVVEFDDPKVTAFLTSYTEEIPFTGSQFPYGREREVSIKLLSDAFQLDCVGTIKSASMITFRLPKDGVISDVYTVSVRFGVNPGANYLNTGLQLTLYQPSEFEPKTIMGNPDAWNSEMATNYISIWGFAFNNSVKLTLRFCEMDDITSVVAAEECIIISANELRVQLTTFPPTGMWRILLAPSTGNALPEDCWDFGVGTYLQVFRLQSFFPLFGEILPEDQSEQMSVMTDVSSMDVYRPSLRWRAQSGIYEVIQSKVQVEQGRLICSIPTIEQKIGHQLDDESFVVDCSVDHHSTRTYGPPGSFFFNFVETPIWRAVNPADRFRFVVVKNITPSYAGARGGELITVTFSSSIRTTEDKDSELAVWFGDVPGTNTRWISDKQIAVNTPELSPSPQLTLTVKVHGENLRFSNFSVYTVTEVNPSFGIQSSQPLHAFGKFLPPGKSGKIYVSLQDTNVDKSNPPKLLPKPSSTSSTPLPSSDDFWFYLPRGLDTTKAYDIWYCPEGNTVASLIPTAYRPFHITEIKPLACNISQTQRFTLDGEFPSELRQTTLTVRFENRVNSKQFVDVPAQWASDAILETKIEAGTFPDVCDLLVKVAVGQEKSSHYVNTPGTAKHTLISVYRLSSLVNTLIPSSYGGDSFIVIDNIPDHLGKLVPSIRVGDKVVDGRLRTSGPDGIDIPGILFTAPPLRPGKYSLEATLDKTALTWGTIESDCSSLFYYDPLPKTNAQAIGVALKTKSTGANPFVFKADPYNKDKLSSGQCLSNGQNLPLLNSDTPLQILNLTGSNRLCNGDPVALRTIVSSKWRCLRLRRYTPAFSLDVPPAPDAIVVDDSEASAEYPDCRESLFGIWRVLPDKDGHPYIDPSLQAEIRLDADRVLIVSQTFSQEIDPSLVEINHALKSNNGSGGGAATAPILDLDLVTPVGIGPDFLTASRPQSVPSGVMISNKFQVAVIDAFVDFSVPRSVSYGNNESTEDVLYAKSTSSLIIDSSTMYVFASDISGSKGNNIWYWKVQNEKPVWKPLYNPYAAQQHVMDSKGNVRAVRVTASDIVLFQQSQSTGLLRAIIVIRNTSNDELTPQQTIKLDSGLESLPRSAGAPIFYSKFTVLYDDTGKSWHILTVPANEASSVIHVKYNALANSPFIDRDSGTFVSRYGIPPPDIQGSVTRFYGFQGSILEVGSTAWYGSTAISISAVATSESSISFNRYGGPDVVVNFDSTTSESFKDVTISGLDHVNSGIGDVIEVDNKLNVVFKAKGQGFKTGDQWLFQVLPAAVSAAKPHKNGQLNITASGVFTNGGPLSLVIEVTDVVALATSSSGEKFVQVTLKSSWYKDPDPSSESSARVLEHSAEKDYTVGASAATCNLDNYGVSIILPPIPQSDDDVGGDGVPVARISKGDLWTIQCHQNFAAVECISQPPAACFVDSIHKQAYLTLSIFHGSGSMIFLNVDLADGKLLKSSLSPLRTVSEFQIHTVNNTSTLVYRGVMTPGVTWANAISREVDDAQQSTLYPRLGKAYRMAHLGSLYKISMSSSIFDTPKTALISADLEPVLIQLSCVALVPPGFNTVGAVEVLGAGHLSGFDLKNGSAIYRGLTACSTVSQRVNTGIFAPSFIYNIDRQGLLEIQTKVKDALKSDLSNQYSESGKSPFSDGSPIWNVEPIFSDADYGDDYRQWEKVFKWLYQLSLCQSLVEQGASWSGDIHHKVAFVIPIGDTHRAAGKDFWFLRIGMERQKMLLDVAMTLRAFKYRLSFHLKEQVAAAFKDLGELSAFGGVANIAAVSVCHPVTLSQLTKLPHTLLDGILGDIITELRYLDSNIYGQVLSNLNSWAIITGLSSLMSVDTSVVETTDSDDDNYTPPPEHGRKRSEVSRIAESLGPIAVFAAGGMIAYRIYKKKSATKAAGEKVAEINARKGPKDGVREFNRASESTRSWATDGNLPRTMPTKEFDMEDLSNSFKADDAVLRDGRDLMEKVKANPELLDGSPQLKEHVSELEKEGSSSGHGRVGAVMEGAFTGLMVLNLVGNWDQMGTSSKVLEIAGVACIGTKMLGSVIGSKFPCLIKGAQAGLEAFGEKIGATVGEKFLASASARFLSAAGRSIAMEGMRFLGPIGNIAFAVEGIISAVDDFKKGKVFDGALELASSLALLGAALCDLLVLAGATAAEGIGEVLMVVVIIIMLVEIFKDPEGFVKLMEELGSEIFGFESPEDEAIDDLIVKLKNWVLSTTLSMHVNYNVSPYDDWPRIIKRDDLALTRS